VPDAQDIKEVITECLTEKEPERDAAAKQIMAALIEEKGMGRDKAIDELRGDVLGVTAALEQLQASLDALTQGSSAAKPGNTVSKKSRPFSDLPLSPSSNTVLAEPNVPLSLHSPPQSDNGTPDFFKSSAGSTRP